MSEKPITDPKILFNLEAIKADDAAKFAGHETELRRCLNTLGSGMNCVIFGERGVGKTSLAWQAASILDETNRQYRKSDLMVVGAGESYRCVFHKCRDKITSLENLLLDILLPSSEPYSMSQVFKDVYQDETVNTQIRRTYSIDLFSMLQAEWQLEDNKKAPEVALAETFKGLPVSQTARRLFDDVLLEIHKHHPDLHLVIFVDEMDKTQINQGLGSFIKDLNHAQLVLIGIADNISQIIRDHESAARRMVGGDIELPGLTADKIRQIFTNAEILSRGGVSFSTGFLAKAVQYSAGFPWIAQNIGFQSIFQKLVEGGLQTPPIRINVRAFKPALLSVMTIYQREIQATVDFDASIDQVTKSEILEHLWSSESPQSQTQIEAGVKPLVRRWVESALPRLEEDGMIKRVFDKRWKFRDPIIRIFWRFYQDEKNTEEN